MRPEVPPALAQEHANLLAGIEAAKQEAGALGEAARAIAEVLEAHVRKEEQFVFPPLGLLPALAEDRTAEGIVEALAMSRRLRTEFPELLIEHRQIREGIERLRAAAIAANRPSFERYADGLLHHLELEDEVLYLAALLVGEYLLLRRDLACHGRAVKTVPPSPAALR